MLLAWPHSSHMVHNLSNKVRNPCYIVCNNKTFRRICKTITITNIKPHSTNIKPHSNRQIHDVYFSQAYPIAFAIYPNVLTVARRIAFLCALSSSSSSKQMRIHSRADTNSAPRSAIRPTRSIQFSCTFSCLKHTTYDSNERSDDSLVADDSNLANNKS